MCWLLLAVTTRTTRIGLCSELVRLALYLSSSLLSSHALLMPRMDIISKICHQPLAPPTAFI
jgi:hypothetical protein